MSGHVPLIGPAGGVNRRTCDYVPPVHPLVLLLIGIDLPGTSSVSVTLADPTTCRGCHGDYDPAESPYDTWAGSPMAHTARNPLFLAALTEAEKDVPGVGDFCLRCH